MKIFSLKRLNSLLIFSFFFCFISCGVGPKSGSNSTLNSVSKGFYTSFYKDDKETLYFIKPMVFEADKEKLMADITFVKNDNIIENVVINFSLLTKDKIATSDITAIKIIDKSIEDFKILYNEPKSSNSFQIRCSLPYKSEDFVLNHKKMTFTIITKNATKSYYPNKKSVKILEDIALLFN